MSFDLSYSWFTPLAVVAYLFNSPVCGQTVVSETNVTLRVMAANLTSGTGQAYESPGIRIFQGLKPDVVTIQEFNYSDNSAASLRSFVNTAFGTNFSYYRESGYSIPNGIISRYPIVTSGSWVDVDAGVNDRGFAWAQIDVPGTNDLYAVSIHLKASNTSTDPARRYAQTTNLVNLIKANFRSNAWIVVGGDCNIYDPSEQAYQHLTNNFVDSPIPTDAETGGDPDTNSARGERYDYVFSSSTFASRLTATVCGTRSFPKGLVLDTRIYTPLSDVAPALAGDSGVSGMQHMGVVRSFSISYLVSNIVATPPTIVVQPAGQTVPQGANATFTVQATGSSPLTYQWRRNGSPMPGASQSNYVLSSAQPVDMGAYSVLITNSAGAATSSDAMLALQVPQPVLSTPAPGVITWDGLSNLVYRVEASTSLNATGWTTIGTAASPSSHISFTNQSPDPSGQCYRVVYP